jgi:hypothetical protein
MKHSVLVKRIVNVRIDGFDSATHAESIGAAEHVDFGKLFRQFVRQVTTTVGNGSTLLIRYVEDGEETPCYLVDEEGDEECENSRWYGSDGVTPLDPGNVCGECLRPREKASELPPSTVESEPICQTESQKLHLVLDEVAAEINRRIPDAKAYNEHTGGGIFCVYARIKADDLDRGYVYVIGTADETWGASVFTEALDDAAFGDICIGNVETEIPSESIDASAVVDAILRGKIIPEQLNK